MVDRSTHLTFARPEHLSMIDRHFDLLSNVGSEHVSSFYAFCIAVRERDESICPGVSKWLQELENRTSCFAAHLGMCEKCNAVRFSNPLGAWLRCSDRLHYLQMSQHR